MENTKTKDRQSATQVLLFPARLPEFEGRRVYYLFSILQVAEVLHYVDVRPVPSASPYAEGVAEWCGRTLPVLSLEHCLGINVSNEQMPMRSIVVRSVSHERGKESNEVYAICNVGGAVRQMKLPLACEPASEPEWVVHTSFLSGVYQTRENLVLVVNLDKILNAQESGGQDV